MWASSLALLLLLQLTRRGRAHSWMSCVDWDDAAATCAGRPRNWKNNMLGQPFGQDVGRDNQPGALAQAACSTQKEARTNPPSAAYSSAAVAHLSPSVAGGHAAGGPRAPGDGTHHALHEG